MNQDDARQKVFTKRVAALCILGMQCDRYHTDMDYRDALNAVLEMIPDPFRLLLNLEER